MIEDKDVARFQSATRSLVRRVDDPEALHQACQLLDELQASLADRVEQLRAGVDGYSGYSWAELAAPFGMTRQGMAQRWARRHPTDPRNTTTTERNQR